MDRLPEMSPLGALALGVWSVVLSLWVNRWGILLGALLGISLCRAWPAFVGLSPAPLDARTTK